MGKNQDVRGGEYLSGFVRRYRDFVGVKADSHEDNGACAELVIFRPGWD
jgi:hypothetical protein